MGLLRTPGELYLNTRSSTQKIGHDYYILVAYSFADVNIKPT